MFQAQYLFKDNEVYTDWLARQGDTVRLTADLIKKNNADLEILAYIKNEEDEGDGAPIFGQDRLTMTATGRGVVEWHSLKELVRFRIRCKVTSGFGNEFVALRVLELVWFDAVGA